MPFTPFHFGPGAALKFTFGRHFSLSLFCVAQVVTDLEVLFYMARGEQPWHRFLHTYVGAGVTTAISVAFGWPLCRVLVRKWEGWKDAPLHEYFWPSGNISFLAALTGAALGAFSHVLLDSVMHADTRPLQPFRTDNPLYGLLGPGTLHGLCFALGVIGIFFCASRSRRRS
jgi:hypothetical protein